MADTELTTTAAPAPEVGPRSATEAHRRRRRIVLIASLGLAVVSLGLLVWTGLPSSVGSKAWFYSLDRITRHGAAIVVVAIAVALSTVLFQTITGNRILTPSLMGFDSLYMLIQTVIIFFLVPQAETVAAGIVQGGLSSFFLETVIMMVASTSLYLWVLGGRRAGIHLLLLVGIVFGLFFRSISTMFQRLMDPASYLLLQDAMFASFRTVTLDVLIACAVIVAACVAVIWRLGPRLDVMLLGRDPAVALGVDHRRMTIGILVLVSALVSASTALVGPITFFGLIVAHAAYGLLRTSLHRYTLPVASALGVVALAGGEVLLRAIGIESALSIVVEFLGGLLFLFLVLRVRVT